MIDYSNGSVYCCFTKSVLNYYIHCRTEFGRLIQMLFDFLNINVCKFESASASM